MMRISDTIRSCTLDESAVRLGECEIYIVFDRVPRADLHYLNVLYC